MTNTERIQANNAELREAIELAESLPDATEVTEPIIKPLSVTENGTYTAPSGVDGYSPVTVNVPIPEGYIKPSGTKSITANGTHDVTEYASVNVNVASGGGGDDTMVGAWIFNEVLDITLDGDYPIKMTMEVWGETEEIDGIGFSGGQTQYMCLYTDIENSNAFDAYEQSEWYCPRRFDITEEPNDAECIAWLKANARKATYKDGFAEGEKAILSTYIDWSVSTTSNSCIVEFYNDCDFYAHINLDVHETTEGETYHESFVLAPYEEYYISEGDMGWQDLSGGEWMVTVNIPKFSTDGEE